MRMKPHRSPRKAGAAGALLRAFLFVGPLAGAIAFGLAPRGEDRLVAANGSEGIDTMTTGSISSSRFTFAPGGGCMRLPGSMGKGTC